MITILLTSWWPRLSLLSSSHVASEYLPFFARNGVINAINYCRVCALFFSLASLTRYSRWREKWRGTRLQWWLRGWLQPNKVQMSVDFSLMNPWHCFFMALKCLFANVLLTVTWAFQKTLMNSFHSAVSTAARFVVFLQAFVSPAFRWIPTSERQLAHILIKRGKMAFLFWDHKRLWFRNALYVYQSIFVCPINIFHLLRNFINANGSMEQELSANYCELYEESPC